MTDDDLVGPWARATDPDRDPITPDEVRALADASPAPEPVADLDRARTARRLRLLAAAAVVVVVALVGSLAWANRDSRSDHVRSRDALDQSAGGAGMGPSATGRTWKLQSVTLNRGDVAVPGAGTPDAPTLDLTEVGQILFTGCNTGGGPGVMRDGEIKVDGWTTEQKGCTGTQGEALMDLDHIMSTSLEHGVTVDLTFTTLTLTQMAMTATFVDPDPPFDLSGGEGMGTVRVQLEPTTGPFIEGFEVGLRFLEADGTVLSSTLWSDFVESTGSTDIDAYYDSVLEEVVPAGAITVQAEVAIGPAGPPTPPDLAADLPCQLTVDLDPNEVADVEVSFDNRVDNCLRLLPRDPAGTTTSIADGATTTTAPAETTTSTAPDVGRTDTTTAQSAPEGTTTVPAAGGTVLPVGSDHYVDVDLQCEAFELAGTWTLVEGDLSSWQPRGERHEGGTFTLDTATTGTFRGDAAGTKVATFRLLGAGESPRCEPVPR